MTRPAAFAATSPEGGDVQATRGTEGRRAPLFAGVFAAALAAGVAYPLVFIYAAKASLYLLLGGWSWSPVTPEELSAGDLFSAVLAAGPLALFGAAAFPTAACLSATRPGLGRHLMGRHPSVGCPELDEASRERLRRGLQRRLGKTVVLDPPPYLSARLSGFVAGLVLFCAVSGGTP